MHLDPSALFRMTMRAPRLVGRYAADPDSYEEKQELERLALDALHPVSGDRVFIVGLPGQNAALRDPVNLDRENGTHMDVARVLTYARNLALTGGLRERPSFQELLTAAVSTIGSRYAGRLYSLATQEPATSPSLGLPELSYGIKGDRQGYFSGDQWFDVGPWWPTPDAATIHLLEIESIPPEKDWVPPVIIGAAGEGDVRYWGAYPSDETEYEDFIRYVLRRASMADPGEAIVTPFSTGLLDGVDVRATIRHWADKDIYVRQEQRARMNVVHGIIDWTNLDESSPVLQGMTPGGWIDPDLLHVGSVSREVGGGEVVQLEPYLIQIDRRQFSFITLESPTWIENAQPGQQSLYDLVVSRLLAIQKTSDDNLYGWLEVMFDFSKGMAVAYYSRYLPSARVRAIARKYAVDLHHIPLNKIPEVLLRQHQQFRFMNLSVSQWREMRSELSRQGLWDMAAILKEHDTAPA